jgi:hypothetical protein
MAQIKPTGRVNFFQLLWITSSQENTLPEFVPKKNYS